ncbi:hypothetical protein DL770_007555 [Monosporascus sp. CRB-9-2]|nr:hypothetical protein DL770_007555 [Monosporascus sp. CRB-9-2]
MTLPYSVLLAVLLAVKSSKVLALPAENSIVPTPTASNSFATPHFEPVSEIVTNEPVRGSGPPPAKLKKDGWDIVEYYEADSGFITAYAPTDAEAFNALVGINATESEVESLERCGGRPANWAKAELEGPEDPKSCSPRLSRRYGRRVLYDLGPPRE